MEGLPEIDEATLQGLGAALLSGRWAVASSASIWKRRNGLAEAELARRFQCSHAITFCNGSAALVVALQALGIGPGSRVLLPALTWIGCVTAVLRLGATPLLADSADDRLTANLVQPHDERPDAIIAIPLYSQTVDLDAIRTAYPGCPVVLDLSHVSCALTSGLKLAERDILVSSLQASKVLTCGEGGFAGTNNPKLAHRMQGLRTDGRVLDGNPSDGRSVLAPGRGVHGANYALSEISAALLLDQLRRLSRQCRQRAAGGSILLDRLDVLGLIYHADPDCVKGGLHYGIPVSVSSDPATVIDRIRHRLGIRLDRCYPPLPDSPLFAPACESRYRGIPIVAISVPNARKWHETTVIVPHQTLSLPHHRLESLADWIAGKAKARATKALCLPGITVIILTDGRRQTLKRTLASVQAQHYRGAVEVLMILDRCDLPEGTLGDIALPVKQVRIDLDEPIATIQRVAKLRDIALRLCETPLVCFLDDDNFWEPHHLQSLQQKMHDTGSPAVHCWRRIAPRSEWSGDRFPWLPQGTPSEQARLEICRRAGIIVSGSDILRDTAYAETAEGDGSMIDLGAWLLSTNVLRMFGLSAVPPASNAPIEGTGEDDILLAKLKAAGIPIVCTEDPTLEYTLGGFSNNLRSADHWRSP